MATWGIKYQPHGLMVTCQRPIVLETQVLTGSVAHFRCTLYIKDLVTGLFVNTGTQLNAYNNYDPSGSLTYGFNVAEYCRHYFTEEHSFYQGSAGLCSNFTAMVSREFKVRIYPIEYDANGNLSPQPDDYEDSNPFKVIPTNTEARELTSSIGDNIRLDKWVFNGTNDSSAPMLSSWYNRLLTNMPSRNVVNVDAGYSYYNALHRKLPGRLVKVNLWNASGVMYSLLGDFDTGYIALPILPVLWDFMLSLDSGTQVYAFTDAAGSLSSNYMMIHLTFVDETTGAQIRSSPGARYTLKEGFDCDKEDTFIFRNMRGGFDFFNATGTKQRSVELSGTEFDRHTDFNRAYADFDLLRGQHNTTNLWSSRKETYSVFSQPVTKEYAIWLEELIMSPQAWIVKDIKDYQHNLFSGKGLLAINILKGSYKTYSTEKNVHFVEFKYTLSENTITQKM
tara:strand:- start:9882 stop:11231 length:1350 start_codon:yes stop_codon:yes gene_type:complete